MKTYIKLYTKGGGKLTFRVDGPAKDIYLEDFNKSHCQDWALIMIPENRKYSFRKEGPVGSISRFYHGDGNNRICFELYNYKPCERCEPYQSQVRVDRFVIETRDGNTVTKICDIQPDEDISGYHTEKGVMRYSERRRY